MYHLLSVKIFAARIATKKNKTTFPSFAWIRSGLRNGMPHGVFLSAAKDEAKRDSTEHAALRKPAGEPIPLGETRSSEKVPDS